MVFSWKLVGIIIFFPQTEQMSGYELEIEEREVELFLTTVEKYF